MAAARGFSIDPTDRKSTRLNSSHSSISYAVFCLKKKTLFMVESNTNSVFRFQIGSNGSVSAPEVYASECGRFPDGLTLDAEGNLYVCCYASDEIWRISPAREKTLFAWDPWAILLGSPTNMAFGGKNFDELYIANLARMTIFFFNDAPTTEIYTLSLHDALPI